MPLHTHLMHPINILDQITLFFFYCPSSSSPFFLFGFGSDTGSFSFSSSSTHPFSLEPKQGHSCTLAPKGRSSNDIEPSSTTSLFIFFLVFVSLEFVLKKKETRTTHSTFGPTKIKHACMWANIAGGHALCDSQPPCTSTRAPAASREEGTKEREDRTWERKKRTRKKIRDSLVLKFLQIFWRGS